MSSLTLNGLCGAELPQNHSAAGHGCISGLGRIAELCSLRDARGCRNKRNMFSLLASNLDGPVALSVTLPGLYLATRLRDEYPPGALLWWVVGHVSWTGYWGKQMLPGLLNRLVLEQLHHIFLALSD